MNSEMADASMTTTRVRSEPDHLQSQHDASLLRLSAVSDVTMVHPLGVRAVSSSGRAQTKMQLNEVRAAQAVAQSITVGGSDKSSGLPRQPVKRQQLGTDAQLVPRDLSTAFSEQLAHGMLSIPSAHSSGRALPQVVGVAPESVARRLEVATIVPNQGCNLALSHGVALERVATAQSVQNIAPVENGQLQNAPTTAISTGNGILAPLAAGGPQRTANSAYGGMSGDNRAFVIGSADVDFESIMAW